MVIEAFLSLYLVNFCDFYTTAVDPTSTAKRNDGLCCIGTSEGDPADAACHRFSAATTHSNN